jgi:hypothetical protein
VRQLTSETVRAGLAGLLVQAAGLAWPQGVALPPCAGTQVERWTGCVGTYEDRASGVRYTGEFVNGTMDGVGLMHTPITIYAGGFSKGRMHGQGVLTMLQDRRQYIGGFRNGLMHGQGTIVAADGRTLLSGSFQDGALPAPGSAGLTPAGARPGFGARIGDPEPGQRPGARVIEVTAGSPARRGGLLPGDIVVSLGGWPITRASELGSAVNALEQEGLVQLRLVRNGIEMEVGLPLAALGAAPAGAPPAPAAPPVPPVPAAPMVAQAPPIPPVPPAPASPPPGPAAAAQLRAGLFLATRPTQGGTEFTVWYFAEGRFARDAAAAAPGLDFALAERQRPGSTGTLALAGDRLTLSGPAFPATSARLEPAGDGCLRWSGRRLCPAPALPSGTRLAGSFVAPGARPGALARLTLRADGAYELVRTAVKAGAAVGRERGRYEIEGHQIRFAPEGGSAASALTLVPVDDGSAGPAPRRLHLGGVVLRRG